MAMITGVQEMPL